VDALFRKLVVAEQVFTACLLSTEKLKIGIYILTQTNPVKTSNLNP
jgi:hypothetical protein